MAGQQSEQSSPVRRQRTEAETELERMFERAHKRMYELWLEEAIQAGLIEAPGFYENKVAYCRVRWIRPGWGSIDPIKERAAYAARDAHYQQFIQSLSSATSRFPRGRAIVRLARTALAVALIATLFLSGCAAAPISETPIPQADLAGCEALSEQHNAMPRLALRAGIGAATGSIVTSAIRHAGNTIIARVGGYAASASSGFSMPGLVLPFAAFALVDGLIQESDRRSVIVRECLRDLGHKVY